MQSLLVESGEWQAQQGVKVIDASTDHLWPLLSCSPSLESTPPLLCLLEFYASTVSWLLVPTPLHQLLCGLMSCHHTYLSFSFKMIRACSDRIYSPSNDYTNIWHQVWVRGRVGKGQTSDLTISSHIHKHWRPVADHSTGANPFIAPNLFSHLLEQPRTGWGFHLWKVESSAAFPPHGRTWPSGLQLWEPGSAAWPPSGAAWRKVCSPPALRGAMTLGACGDSQ